MITSANTARNHVPAILTRVDRLDGWREGTVNLDVGGGPFGTFTRALAGHLVANHVYDPFNRSGEHNMDAIERVQRVGGAATATLSNVLNVIPNAMMRRAALAIARQNLHVGGVCYVTVHEGDRSGQAHETRDGWQENRRLATYAHDVRAIFGNVTQRGGMLRAVRTAD